MKKFSKVAMLVLLMMGLMSTVAFADSLSFTSIPLFSNVTITSDGAGGTQFSFGPANISGATPPTDSLNFFPNNPFLIGGGIVLHPGGNFNPFATLFQVGNNPGDKAGLLT